MNKEQIEEMLKKMSAEQLLETLGLVKEALVTEDRRIARKEKSDVVLEVGKKYKRRDGKKVLITGVDTLVYSGVVIGKREFGEWYINGRAERESLSQQDIVGEIK